ncbi:MAG TPA: DUF6502 family protein [Burkholderiaceae bacterium]
MDVDDRLRHALDQALARLLRPLVRVLLRHAVPFSGFMELAKRAYVASALEDFAIPGKKPSISRASILTGLTRKEVQRLLEEPASGTRGISERYNRAARVLTGWVRDANFHDAKGAPRALVGDGPRGFAELVRRHSGDMPARAVLDELLRVGAVRRRKDGRFEPIARGYVPHQSVIDKVDILGTDVADLVDTIDHNLQHGVDDPRFQRKVMYHSIRSDALPAFRKVSAAQAQALLEKLDRWLASHDDIDTPHAASEAQRSRVGVGIYYFEERVGSTAPERDRT